MSTTTKQYTPTATARPTWREREAQKQREQQEAALRAKEEAELKKFALTEENFPSLMKAADRMTVPDLPAGKFADLASKLNTAPVEEVKQEEVPLPGIRTKRKHFRRADDDAESYVYVREEEEPVVKAPKETLSEKYPPHGKRGTYSTPDSEGWRYVTKKKKVKAKRTLTEAELQRKYREEFFGEGEEESADMNAELAESNQRREFY